MTLHRFLPLLILSVVSACTVTEPPKPAGLAISPQLQVAPKDLVKWQLPGLPAAPDQAIQSQQGSTTRLIYGWHGRPHQAELILSVEDISFTSLPLVPEPQSRLGQFSAIVEAKEFGPTSEILTEWGLARFQQFSLDEQYCILLVGEVRRPKPTRIEGYFCQPSPMGPQRKADVIRSLKLERQLIP